MDQNNKIAALLDANYELADALRETSTFASSQANYFAIGAPITGWNTDFVGVQVGASGTLWGTLGFGGSQQINLLENVKYNSSNQFIYLTTAAASRYLQNAGTHRFFGVGSGDAGNEAILGEVAKFDLDATSGNTRFLIYDVDNATLERVSVGAADSGGAGYKVLRIPN